MPTKDFGKVFHNVFDPELSYTNTAAFHNSIPRGKNITSYLTDTSLWNRINGTNGYKLFEDLFIGDYIVVGDNTYVIADFDYYIRCGSVDITAHHLIMVPAAGMSIPAGTALYGASGTLTLLDGESATAKKWNPSNSTAGGYKFSRMRQTIMKAANTIVINAFGAVHVLPITVLYPNPSSAADSGLASGWTWFADDSQTSDTCKSICDLLNETQVYGQQVWGQGSAFGNMGYEVGTDKFQLSIFALDRAFADIRAYWWLRSVSSAADAALVNATGDAGYYGASRARGVRPRFLLVG